MSTNNLEFGISVGISRIEDVQFEQVYLHIANMGSVSIDTTTARHIAMQLLMMSDFLEKRVSIKTEDPHDH